MRSLLVGCIMVFTAFGSVHAAQFLNEPYFSFTGEMQQNIIVLPDGRLAVEIDDMRFLVRGPQKSVSEGTAWTGGVVYYLFDASVDADDGGVLSGDGAARRTAFRDAADEWENTVPGLTFVEGMGAGNYILVKSAGGNNSFVGMITGAQDLNIASWLNRFVIAHEIGHALGLLHEQSRTDRNTYVSVFFENILDDREDNYAISPASSSHGPYDYGSVMHYGRCAFWDDAAGTCGTDGFTLSAVPAGAASVGMTESSANAVMGQAYELSSGDITGVRSSYPSGPNAIFSDGVDAGHTRSWSNAVGEEIICAHDPCAIGVALHPSCDTCATDVCNLDSWCCEAEWDSICVSIAESTCGLACP